MVFTIDIKMVFRYLCILCALERNRTNVKHVVFKWWKRIIVTNARARMCISVGKWMKKKTRQQNSRWMHKKEAIKDISSSSICWSSCSSSQSSDAVKHTFLSVRFICLKWFKTSNKQNVRNVMNWTRNRTNSTGFDWMLCHYSRTLSFT